jgi:hypothetical protein
MRSTVYRLAKDARPLPGPFEEWLAQRGTVIADLLDAHVDGICDATSAQILRAFPSLCYDPHRFDAVAFQRSAIRQTPHRLHKLVRFVLVFQSMAVVEQEYRWACGVMPRYGVNRTHMLATAGWYFNAARAQVPFGARDKVFFNGMKQMFLQTITHVAADLPTERSRAVSDD